MMASLCRPAKPTSEGLERANASTQLRAGIAQPEAEIQSHLVIPATGGVELSASRTDASCQLGLDVHVDILEVLAEFEFPRLDLGADFQQSGLDLRKFLCR
jgi:hypothetical protein